MMATTANQRIDVGALRNGDAVLTAEPAQASLRQQIALRSIQTDGGTQMRAALNQDTVEEYRSYMAENGWGDFDPVVVYYDGAAYWLADGFHRIEAYRKVGVSVGDTLVPAFVHAGARRDAILHAAGANARHGLRRTNADKRRAVETVLRDAEWSQWSNEEIARRCAVDPKTVGAIRKELTATLEIPESTYRKGADGRVIDARNIGGKPVTYLSVDQIILALRPVLSNDTGAAIWECAAGRNQAMFVACQQALAPERVRQHELYMALYKLAEERGISLSGNAVNGDRPLPDWAQTDDANAASTPVPASPRGVSADLPTTPLDGVSGDYSEEGVDLTWDLPPDLRADGWTLHVEPAGEMIASHPQHGELLDRHFDGNVADMRARMKELTSGSALVGPKNYLQNDKDVEIYNALLRAAATYINEWHLKDTSSERVRVLKGQYNLLFVEVRKLIKDPDLPEFRFIRIWNGAIQMERYKDASDLGPASPTPGDALEETLRTHFSAPLPTASSDPWLTAAVAPVRRQERAALLADALQPWIREYTDEYGRDWKHLAEYGNPSHSNSTFWQDIQKECQRRNVRIDDDILKGAIKQAFATMLAQHQAEAPATEPAVDESGATAPQLPPIELPSHADAETRVRFRSAGRASSNDLVQKHGYGFGFNPKPPYGDGLVSLSHHDREAHIHRKLGVFATGDEADRAARRDLQERIAAAVPPLETPPAVSPVEEEPAVQSALPPVPPDLAAAGWELHSNQYGNFYMVNAATSQSTRTRLTPADAFDTARGLMARDPAPDAARSTWAYWEAQGWRLVRDSKLQTTTGLHDATGLATPTLISEAGVIHWLASGGELTEAAYRVATKQPPSPADERNARIKAMIATLTAARDLGGEYEKTTGIYTHSNNLRQAIRPMIEMLERNLTDKVMA